MAAARPVRRAAPRWQRRLLALVCCSVVSLCMLVCPLVSASPCVFGAGTLPFPLEEAPPVVLAPAPLTTILDGLPMPQAGTITSFAFSTFNSSIDEDIEAVLQSPFLLQLYRPCQAGGSDALCLQRSVQLQPELSSFVLLTTTSLSWPVAAGDVIGFAPAPSSATSMMPLPFVQPPSEARDTVYAAFSLFNAVKTDFSSGAQGGANNAMSISQDFVQASRAVFGVRWTFQPMDSNSQPLCPQPLMEFTSTCALGEALDSSKLSADLYGGITVLLEGRPFLVADEIRAFRIRTASNVPFRLQLWRSQAPKVAAGTLGARVEDMSTTLRQLKQSVLVTPGMHGPSNVLVYVDWPVLPGDVVGYSLAPGASIGALGAGVTFGDASDPISGYGMPEAEILLVNSSLAAQQTVGGLLDVAPAIRTYRAYNLRIDTFAACAVGEGPVQMGVQPLKLMPLHPTDNPDAPPREDPSRVTTVLVGQAATSDAAVVELSFYASNLNTVELQLLRPYQVATVDDAGNDALETRFELHAGVSVTPSIIGVQRVPVDWRFHVGDVLAISSVSASPVFFRPDADPATLPPDVEPDPTHTVLQYDEILSVASDIGQSLRTTPTSLQRVYNLRVRTRALGRCSGFNLLAGSVPTGERNADGTPIMFSIVEGSTLIGSCSSLQSSAADNNGTPEHIATCSLACASRFSLQGDSQLTCPANSTGELHGLQRCVPSPCSLPVYPNSVAGTCISNTTLADGESCMRVCAAGFVSNKPTTLVCSGSVLHTNFTGCTVPLPCTPIATPLPTGLTIGNCSTALQHGQACELALTAPYEVVAASATLRCSNGILSPLPTVLQAPCRLPSLGAGVSAGNCPIGSGFLETGKSCAVACAPEYKMFGTPTFECTGTGHVLTGKMPECRKAPRCQLPDLFPEGSTPGSCIPGQFLPTSGGSCAMGIAAGYRLAVDSSLVVTCTLGDLSPLPSFTPLPCALGAIAASRHLTVGTCPSPGSTLESGASCDVACADGYLPEKASMTFMCYQGVMAGTLPQCRLPVCQVPNTLPEGLEAGTCQPNMVMRADGEGYRATCTLQVTAGFTVPAGSAVLACVPGRDAGGRPIATLSPLPTPVQTMLPSIVRGVCQAGFGDWSGVNDVRALPWTGTAQCAVGSALQSWRFSPCNYSGGTGVNVEAHCAANSLVNITTPRVNVAGVCVTGILPHLMFATAGNAVLTCPSEAPVVVGIGWATCGNNGAQLKLVCQGVVSTAKQIEMAGVNSRPRTAGFSSCGINQLHSGVRIRDLSTSGYLMRRPCPYTQFNYMTGVGLGNCASASTESGLLQVVASCVVFDDSTPGLVAAGTRFFGPDVFERPNLDSTLEPKCKLMQSTSLQTTGDVMAFRLHAVATGPVTLQTYARVGDSGAVYVVTGSFKHEVSQLGYQVIGLPKQARWQVNGSHYLGYCYGRQPIIPSSIITGASKGYTIDFAGPPMEVGEEVGGGGDAAVPSPQQAFFSLQIGIAPSNLTSIGWPISPNGEPDTLLDGNCLLLEQPRIKVDGYVSEFSFYAAKNRGEVQLQTYRQDASNQWILQGTFQPPTLKKGYNHIQVGPNDTWAVRPGDVIAHCYTKSSIVWQWDESPVNDWSKNTNAVRALYGRSDDEVTGPNWLSFRGGVQTTVGAPVAGATFVGFYGGPKQTMQRLYSVQFGFTPRSACTPLPKKAQYGSGTVTCDSLHCTLQCDIGFGTSKERQTCQSTGSWGTQGRCEPLLSPQISGSTDLADLDVYGSLIQWGPPAQGLPPGVVHTGWSLRWRPVFPVSSDLLLEAMAGVTVSGELSFGPTLTTFKHVTDTQLQVEHVGVRYEVRQLTSGGGSIWSPVTVFAPCACNMARSRGQSVEAALWGYPLDLAVTQKTDFSNAVQMTFTPNSLCTDRYEVAVSALDGTTLSVEPVEVQAMHVDTRKSCNLLQPMTNKVGTVSYPLHGRELSYCIRARPMFLCEKCLSQYNSGESGSLPEPTCITTRHAFVAHVQGNVRTPVTPGSALRQGVADVKVFAQLLDAETLEPIMVASNPSGGGGGGSDGGSFEPVIAQGLTDSTGAYTFSVSSPYLALEYYVVRVWCEMISTDVVTGISLKHDIVDDVTDTPYRSERVNHMAYQTQMDFVDKSVVPVMGSVVLDPNGAWYGSSNFQGCGVPNIIVKAYSAYDTSFDNPLATAAATGKDGAFVLTVPIYTQVVLRPEGEYSSNRTFAPATMFLDVQQSLIQPEPFIDTTTAKFALSIDGGKCKFHIGSVRPTVFFDTCGSSAHILLPAFAEGDNFFYDLPALVYTVKLFDSKNIFSGLQSVDLDGSVLGDSYLAGPVFNFVALGVSPWTVNLTSVLPQEYAPRWHFNYVAPPDVAVDTGLCKDPKASPSQRYDVVSFKSPASIAFTLTETYGYVATNGAQRIFICQQVDTGIEILDGVTESGGPLLQEYQTAYRCTTGDRICALPAVYNPKDSSTTVEYKFIPGPIQQSDFQSATPGVHTQPAYSRILQWRPAGSVLPWNVRYYVIAGTTAIPGSLSIVYPPYDPLYILRDPPGGASTATLQMGSRVLTRTSLSLAQDSASEVGASMYAGIGGYLSVCPVVKAGAVAPLPAILGGGASTQAEIQVSCIEMLDLKATVGAGFNLLGSDLDEYLREKTLEMKFVEEISTSGDPSVVDGDGDLFLTVSGSVRLSQAFTVSVTFDTVSNPPSTTCVASLKPSLQWDDDPGNTYQWVSQYHVKHALIKDLELSMRNLMREAEVESIEQLQTVDAEAAARYAKNQVARDGWQGMLETNAQLKQDAVEWPEFYTLMRTVGESPDPMSEKEQLKQFDPAAKMAANIGSKRGGLYGINYVSQAAAKNGDVSQADSLGQSLTERYLDPLTAADDQLFDGLDLLSSSNHLASNFSSTRSPEAVNAIEFFGDPSGALHSFVIDVASEDVDIRTVVSQYAIDTTHSLDISSSIVALLRGGQVGGAYHLLISHGTTRRVATQITNQLRITFGDFDDGDQFHVQVLRDPVYGSPVYRVLGGATRCPTEAGTVSREALSLQIGQAAFTHVHPMSTVATLLTFINQSPTRESWTYSLTQRMETNTAGLQIYVNGEPVTSDASTLQFKVEYNVNVQTMIVIEKGHAAASDFPDIDLLAQSTGSGQCMSAATQVSVAYDESCAPVEFAGSLAVAGSFTVNSANVLASPTRTASLLISIRNPQVSQTGRSWLSQANRGYLTSIDVQYRAAGATDDAILSDADWQSIKRVRDSTPSTPILDAVRQGYTATPPTVVQDTIAFSWDMAALADGNYQLRAISTCKVPSGALDMSLYSHVTPVVKGKMDVLPPKVFGSPLPAVGTYYPGRPISVTLTKKIACDSYYGKARVQAWVNPTLVAGAASQGLTLNTRYVCAENTFSIELFAPIWDDLVARLLSVRVDRLYDTAGNEVDSGYIEWSFVVADFNVKASMASVAGLTYQGTVKDMQSQLQLTEGMATLPTVTQVQQQLQSDVAKLVNSFIDWTVRPSPLASTSLDGLQPGGVIVEGLATTSLSSSLFNLQLHAFPQFPGDPAPRYSPSFFASKFLHALDNGTLWRNNTAQYPLLTHLRYSSGSAILSVSPVSHAPAIAGLVAGSVRLPTLSAGRTRSMRTLDASGVSVSDVSVTAGLDPSDETRCIVQLSWMASNLGAAPEEVTLDSLVLNYEQLTMDGMDPDQRNTLALLQPSHADLAAWGSSIMQNVQPASRGSTGQGIYSLQVLRFPTQVGGMRVQLHLSVSAGAGGQLYAVEHELFLMSAPTPPLWRSVQQTDAEHVVLSLQAAQRSGLSLQMGDAGVSYALSVQTQNGNISSTVNVPSSIVHWNRSINARGVPILEGRFSLFQLANTSAGEFVLPSPGATRWLKLHAQSVADASSSSPVSTSLRISTPPPSVIVKRYAQVSANQYLVRFVPVGPASAAAAEGSAENSAVLRYLVVVRQGLTGVIQITPLSPTVVAGSTPLLLTATFMLSNTSAIREGHPLYLSVVAETLLGRTAPVFVEALSPAYVSTPRNVLVTVLRRPTVENRTIDFRLDWDAPEVVRPAAMFSNSLLRGFHLEYTFSDGAALLRAAEQIAVMGSSQRSVRFTLPMYVSPLLQQATLYAFALRARMASSDALSEQYRTDGTGVATVESDPAQAMASVQLPASDFVVAPVAFDTWYSEGGSTEELTAPASLTLYTSDTTGETSARWPMVPGVDGYRVAWFDGRSSSTVPLGIRVVPQADEIDQQFTVEVPLVPDTPAAFFIAKVAVWAYKDQPPIVSGSTTLHVRALESARIVTFISLPALISSSTDYIPHLYDVSMGMDAPLEPLTVDDGTTGHRFRIGDVSDDGLQTTLVLRIQLRNPNMRDFRVRVSEGVISTPVSDVFSTCDLDSLTTSGQVVSMRMVSDQQYTVPVTVHYNTPTTVYLALTAESGAVRYSFVTVTTYQVRGVSFIVTDPAHAGEVMQLVPPFQLGHFEYDLLMPYPTQLNASIISAFNERFQLTLHAPSLSSMVGEQLISNQPSTPLTLNAGQVVSLDSPIDGKFTFKLRFVRSTIKSLRLFATPSVAEGSGASSMDELLLDGFKPDSFQLAVVLPSRVQAVSFVPDYYTVYTLWSSVSGDCGAFPNPGDSRLLAAHQSSVSFPLVQGLNRIRLCSSNGDVTLLEAVRTPNSVTRLSAQVLGERGVQELAWASQLTSGGRMFATTVYSDNAWVSLAAEFLHPKLTAYPASSPINSDRILLLALGSNMTLDRATGQATLVPADQRAERLSSGQQSRWLNLQLGDNAFLFQSGTDGNYTLRIRRLPVPFSRLVETNVNLNESLVLLVAYESAAASATDASRALPLSLDTPFASNQSYYTLATPLPFSHAYVSLTSFASTFGLVRIDDEILPPGSPSAHHFIDTSGTNITLITEDGVGYTFLLTRTPATMQQFQLGVEIADNDEGSFLFSDPLPFEFDPDVHVYDWSIAFGASRLRLEAVIPKLAADAFHVQYNDEAFMQMPSEAGVPLVIPLNPDNTTHTLIIVSLQDGAYQFTMRKLRPVLSQLAVDAVTSVLPAEAIAVAGSSTLRVGFNQPLLGRLSDDGHVVERFPVHVSSVTFQYGVVQLSAAFLSSAPVYAVVSEPNVPLLESSRLVVLEDSTPATLNLSVGLNDVHVLSRDGNIHMQIVREEPDLEEIQCEGLDRQGRLVSLVTFEPGLPEYQVPLAFAIDSVNCVAQFEAPGSVVLELQQATPTGDQNTTSIPRVYTRSISVNGTISAQAPDADQSSKLAEGVLLSPNSSTPVPLAVGANRVQLTTLTDGIVSIVFNRTRASSINLLQRIVVLQPNPLGARDISLPLNHEFNPLNSSYVVTLPRSAAGSSLTFNVSLMAPDTSFYNLTQWKGTGDLMAALDAYNEAQETMTDPTASEPTDAAAAWVVNPAVYFSDSHIGADGDEQLAGVSYEEIQLYPWFRVEVMAEDGAIRPYYVHFVNEEVGNQLLAQEPVAAAAAAIYCTGFAVATLGLLYLLFASPLARVSRWSVGAAGGSLWAALFARALLEWVLYAYPEEHYLEFPTFVVLHALPVLMEIYAIVFIALMWVEHKRIAFRQRSQTVHATPPAVLDAQTAGPRVGGVEDEAAEASAKPEPSGSWLHYVPFFLLLLTLATVILLIASVATNSTPAQRGFSGMLAIALFLASITVLPTLMLHTWRARQTNSVPKAVRYMSLTLPLSSVTLVLGVLMALLLLVPVAYPTAYKLHVKSYHAAYFVFDALLLFALLALLVLRLLFVRERQRLEAQRAKEVELASAATAATAAAAEAVNLQVDAALRDAVHEDSVVAHINWIDEDPDVGGADEEVKEAPRAPAVAERQGAISPLQIQLPPLPASPYPGSPSVGLMSPTGVLASPRGIDRPFSPTAVFDATSPVASRPEDQATPVDSRQQQQRQAATPAATQDVMIEMADRVPRQIRVFKGESDSPSSSRRDEVEESELREPSSLPEERTQFPAFHFEQDEDDAEEEAAKEQEQEGKEDDGVPVWTAAREEVAAAAAHAAAAAVEVAPAGAASAASVEHAAVHAAANETEEEEDVKAAAPNDAEVEAEPQQAAAAPEEAKQAGNGEAASHYVFVPAAHDSTPPAQ